MARPTISGSTMLTGFDFVSETRKGKDGKEYECILIVMCEKGKINDSCFFKTEKGNIGFNWSGWETNREKWEDYKQTHSLTADFGKEVNEKRQKDGLGLINVGKFTDWNLKNSSQVDSVPQQNDVMAPPDNADLPF